LQPCNPEMGAECPQVGERLLEAAELRHDHVTVDGDVPVDHPGVGSDLRDVPGDRGVLGQEFREDPLLILVRAVRCAVVSHRTVLTG
jgi:hypothetical protein